MKLVLERYHEARLQQTLAAFHNESFIKLAQKIKIDTKIDLLKIFSKYADSRYYYHPFNRLAVAVIQNITNNDKQRTSEIYYKMLNSRLRLFPNIAKMNYLKHILDLSKVLSPPVMSKIENNRMFSKMKGSVIKMKKNIMNLIKSFHKITHDFHFLNKQHFKAVFNRYKDMMVHKLKPPVDMSSIQSFINNFVSLDGKVNYTRIFSKLKDKKIPNPFSNRISGNITQGNSGSKGFL